MNVDIKGLLLEAAKRFDGVKIDNSRGNHMSLSLAGGVVLTLANEPQTVASVLKEFGAARKSCVDVDAEIAGPFSFPSFVTMADTIGRRGLSERPKVPPKKSVAATAPKALSTWEFQSKYLQRVAGTKVALVGQHYRTDADREVLGWKRQNNVALLVAEPDNPVDMNAVMVLMWNDKSKHWHHVGYVRATQAALLRGKWTDDCRNVMVARITNIPSNSDGYRDSGKNVELTLTGEVRTYPGYKL